MLPTITYREAGWVAGSLVGLVVAWEVVVRLLGIPAFVLPTPTAVARELAIHPRLYLDHLWVTTYETLLGFGFAALLGVSAAVLIVYSRFLQQVLYPVLVILQIVPKVAIAPLLLIWVGYGLKSKIILALLIAFFPVLVDTVTGLRAVDEELLDLVRVLKGNRALELLKVRFPYALPFIFSGLKVAITLAVIGAIIGEFVGGSQGLGYLVVIANTQLNVAMSFAALTALSLLGLALFAAVVLLERLLVPWESREEAVTMAVPGGSG